MYITEPSGNIKVAYQADLFVAAALCVDKGVALQDVCGKEVRETLIKGGYAL